MVRDEYSEIFSSGTSGAMTSHQNEDALAAIQYLTWALEHILKIGNQSAARHAQVAINALRAAPASKPNMPRK